MPHYDIVPWANVVEAFLKAEIPPGKMDCWCPLLETGFGRQTIVLTMMAQLISPFLLSKELNELRKEIPTAVHVAAILMEAQAWERHLMLAAALWYDSKLLE